MIFSAKWVVPMDGPPIADGEVVVEGTCIVDIRPCRTPAAERRDFGNAVLMPGLVNAHTHLEYTCLRGFLEDIPFFPWIRALTGAKAQLSMDDWVVSAKLGSLECLAGGITTIGDNTDAGVTFDACIDMGLRAIVYQEVFGIDHRDPVMPIMQALDTKLQSMRSRATERVRAGISPHAPYTIRPELFSAIKTYVEDNNLPISMHVAESGDETSLTTNGTGAFAEMYMRRGIEWSCPDVSPTRYAVDQGMLGPRSMAIHCVQQDQDDIDTVSRSGAAIIHCPKSNAKLGAGIAPLIAWLNCEGLRLGIGTDSAVSNNTLDLFEEMRFGLLAQRGLNRTVAAVSARQMIELATCRGADAMGLLGTTGTLTPGKQADMISVDLDRIHNVPATDPYAAILYSARAGDVTMTMVAGKVCYDEGVFPHIDAAHIVELAGHARSKLHAAIS